MHDVLPVVIIAALMLRRAAGRREQTWHDFDLPAVAAERDTLALSDTIADTDQRTTVRQMQIARDGGVCVLDHHKVLFEITIVSVGKTVTNGNDTSHAHRDQRRTNRHFNVDCVQTHTAIATCVMTGGAPDQSWRAEFKW